MLRKIFNFFSRKNSKQTVSKKLETNKEIEEDWTDENSQFQKRFRESQARIPSNMIDDTNDYLGMASEAKYKAIEALENKQFDLAWKIEHERIMHYTNHALKNGYTTNETLGLLATIYSSLSSILQAEEKHTLSLAFYLYSVQCNGFVNEGVQASIRRICRKGKLKHFDSNIEEFLNKHVASEKEKHADLSFCQSEVVRWESEAPFYSDDVQEMMKHYKSTSGYLSLVNGVSKNIEKSLIENNVETIELLIAVEAEELINIKGIGKVALQKINNSLEFMRN
ncbi:helix-hairpin-helix domain-containing protein [Thalassotalea nanhaiensis]|uniref:Helix-hairpin-helix domain-containing protein n=1 Tax=Thalassotalea nanhaiensis TaxID=3065648 RepID=A0ABY9TQD6_9GAMM|nr:helix-hairpin-helix domain-containing protein [Colwelliaceae bacterium SQ345]